MNLVSYFLLNSESETNPPLFSDYEKSYGGI